VKIGTQEKSLFCRYFLLTGNIEDFRIFPAQEISEISGFFSQENIPSGNAGNILVFPIFLVGWKYPSLYRGKNPPYKKGFFPHKFRNETQKGAGA
jgi:hypothetical protein